MGEMAESNALQRKRQEQAMIDVYLGIGANLVPAGYGDLRSGLDAALVQLGQQVKITKTSKWYRSAAVPVSAQPDYLNAVVAAQTTLGAAQLLSVLNDIEQDFGRVRTVRNAARVLDIDLLFYGNEIIQTERLCVPHPRLEQRAFVLKPLMEIAPQLEHPRHGCSVADLLSRFDASPYAGQHCIVDEGG